PSQWTNLRYRARNKRPSVPIEKGGKSARLPFCRLQISARNATRNTSAMVLQKKYSTPSVRLAVFTFRRGHPASPFAEPLWTRGRSGGGLASRRFSTVAFEKLENVSGLACN